MEDLRQQAITYLPGIGPQRAKMLEMELGIKTWHDLLYNFPYKHIDRSRLYKVSELTTEMPFVQVLGQFLSFEEAGEGRRTISSSDVPGYMEAGSASFIRTWTIQSR